MANKHKSQSRGTSFHRELITQFLALSTSGFGLVAALAWNDAIQKFVQQYIDNFFPTASGVFSRFAYAIIITLLAVTITYQLSRLASRWSIKTPKS